MSYDLAAWLREQIASDKAAYWTMMSGPRPGSKPALRERLATCDAHLAILQEHRRYDEWVRESFPDIASPSDGPSCVGCGESDGLPRIDHIDECPTLRALALAYQYRSGYQEKWRP